MQRRDFLNLSAAGGGAVFLSTLAGCANTPANTTAGASDFYFVQLSDVHWGFQGPPNPDAKGTLHKAIAAVNALEVQPEFVVFTGDLTHNTDSPDERRRRMAEFKSIAAGLTTKTVYFMPGEHDAGIDRGSAYQELFGPTHYTFEHRGVHFIALDNVSDPGSKIGEAQLAWLQADLARMAPDAPIVVLTHRPLFDLAPKWDWATRDGAQVLALLMPFGNVTVFYGHIHQEHHHMTGHIAHHSAKSLMFPLPAPGSQTERTPLPWNPQAPYQGLGFRELHVAAQGTHVDLAEYPVVKL